MAPWSCWAEAEGPDGPLDRKALGKKTFDGEDLKLEFDLPCAGAGQETAKFSMNYYYCSDGGLCKIGSVVWTAPLKIVAAADKHEVVLPLKIKTTF